MQTPAESFGVRRRPQAARLTEEQLDELQRARFEMQALCGQELTNTDLLMRFFREKFGEWAVEAIGLMRAAVEREGGGE